MSTPDVEALYETLDTVIAAANIGAWMQEAWIGTTTPDCGFVGCFAGWRAHLDGGKVIREHGYTWMLLPDGTAIDRPDIGVEHPEVTRDLFWLEWTDERFGLIGTGWADVLAAANNTIDNLHCYVEDIALAAFPEKRPA